MKALAFLFLSGIVYAVPIPIEVTMDTTTATVTFTHTDWSQTIDISSVSWAAISGAQDTSQICATCPNDQTTTCWPLAGGRIARVLHFLKLRSLTLAQLRTAASNRGLDTSGTKTDLAERVIVYECNQRGIDCDAVLDMLSQRRN